MEVYQWLFLELKQIRRYIVQSSQYHVTTQQLRKRAILKQYVVLAKFNVCQHAGYSTVVYIPSGSY